MSETAMTERPITVAWGTVFAFLSLLFAGFMAWSAMSERVAVIETSVGNGLPEKMARLEAQNAEILRRLDRMEQEAHR